ncbi:MAG: hypothetical protein M4D80_26250 [Myxococcota bacterium]|nr:hypothetical protein [Deltaproteobacteria bacterium]MDQ3338682.1 hypothetical protein [Myxococcota bacterium]
MAEKKTPVEQTSGTSDLDAVGWIAHAIPAALGVAALIAAFFSQKAGIQTTLMISLLVAGGLLIALSYLSLTRSRAAWSFVISLSIVLAIMTLFGAPKIRTLVGMHMALALVIPALFLAAAVMLSTLGPRYNKS